MIELRDAYKIYSRTQDGIKGISMRCHQGEINVLIGKNGAGKTTTIKSILGFLQLTKGDIVYQNEDISPKKGNASVGFLPELMYFPEQLTVKEILLEYATLRGVSKKDFQTRYETLCDQLDLHGVDKRKLSKLSKGMRQKVGIMQCLIHDPQLLILDEPTSGLDPQARMQLFRLLIEQKKAGKTIIISTHNLDEIERVSDHLFFFDKGKLLDESTLDEIENQDKGVTIEVKGNVNDDEIILLCSELSLASEHVYELHTDDNEVLNRVLQTLMERGVALVSVIPKRMSLQQYFGKLLEKGAGQ